MYQVKGVSPVVIITLNEIADQPPTEFGVNNTNEGILNEYGLDDFILIQHYGYDHGQDDDIKYPPHVN